MDLGFISRSLSFYLFSLSLTLRSLEDRSLPNNLFPFFSILQLFSPSADSHFSSITFLNHVFLGLPFLNFLHGFSLHILPNNVALTLRSTCPNHLNLKFLVTSIICVLLNSLYNSLLFLTLHSLSSIYRFFSMFPWSR